ncbi:uncharacterized protein [Rutidosis leptorrhynchoides]|uniref:uncharacterized protein n=1 Tax=Rutidosis leptorrhynchoides TaxID=125765 RepID=UPI003A99AB3A
MRSTSSCLWKHSATNKDGAQSLASEEHNLLAAIKAIHIAAVPCRDQWIWDHNIRGVYTVKSGYFIAKQLLYPDYSDPFTTSPFGIVSTRDNLIGRGLQSIPGHCEVCLDASESILHFFRDCVWTRNFWAELGINGVILSQHIDARHWLQYVFTVLSSNDLKLFIAATWWIWSNRNDCIFRAKCAIPKAAVSGFRRWFFGFYSMAAAVSTPVPGWSTWPTDGHHPASGMFKVNFDAGFILGSTTNRYGTIVRDQYGRCVGAWSGRLGRQVSALQAEVIAALKSIDLVRTLNLDAVVFEGDCQVLIQELNSSSTSFSVIGNISTELTHKADSYFSTCCFNFVKRDGNRPAHALARHFSFVDLESFGCNNLPHAVAELVRSDAFLA